jgi:hypothetical protein
MDSIDREPIKNEKVICRAKCHWAVLLGPIVVIIIGGLALGSQGFHAAALIAFGLIWAFLAYRSWRRSEIVLTERRVLSNAGFPLSRSYDIPLSKVVHIDFFQPSLGSMLDFGKIAIIYGGQTKCVIRFVSSPGEFVTRVRRQISTLSASSTEN